MPPSTPSKPTALVLAFSNLASDPRVHRQLEWLSGDFNVVALGTGAPVVPGVTFHAVKVQNKTELWPKLVSVLYRLTGNLEAYYWNHDYVSKPARELADLKPDVVIANDIEALPLALTVAKGAPVVYDAHEYSPREFEDLLIWRLWVGPLRLFLCRKFLPKAKAMTTVCQGIADEYKKHFGVTSTLLTSAPKGFDLPVRPTDPTRIRLIHHGAALESRKIEHMITMAGLLDERFELDLMLMDCGGPYMAKLRELVKAHPNVRLIPTVPMPEIVPFIAQYDIGLFLLEPTNFNYLMALPNKFFEFMQARLAIAIGPSPEMARIVKESECGIVASDFEPATLAGMLNALTPEQIDHYKQQSDKLAGIHSAEANGTVFRSIVAQAMS